VNNYVFYPGDKLQKGERGNILDNNLVVMGGFPGPRVTTKLEGASMGREGEKKAHGVGAIQKKSRNGFGSWEGEEGGIFQKQELKRRDLKCFEQIRGIGVLGKGEQVCVF